MMQAHHRSRPMIGKTVLVTGCTGGIGKATALRLAALGAHVAVTGRDPQRTEDAVREIRAAGGGPVDSFTADLSTQSEVRRVAGEALGRLPRTDALVNDVGGYWNTRHLTADGLERTFALNHLAPFLLTNLLLDRLEDSARARVVIVASNALQPGMVRTGFGADDPAGTQRVFVPPLRPFMTSVARGAVTSIHVTSAPELAEVSGRYFVSSTATRSSPRSYGEAVTRRLWQVSAGPVGLTATG
ncbi:SDR family NAD(P)-dependent oxidoreductase [Geodermatophilus sp. URMC 62]|uniref:SDR family NAD(P)-dependent oxidoreductase n=1 Tax=Geodermatophilus sp. URMC 62 TaxID=3423414 RepID=UPI00406C10B8